MYEKTVLDLGQLSEEVEEGVRRLTIDIPNEQHAALKELSVKYHVPMARFIRDLLATWLREQGILEPHGANHSSKLHHLRINKTRSQ